MIPNGAAEMIEKLENDIAEAKPDVDETPEVTGIDEAADEVVTDEPKEADEKPDEVVDEPADEGDADATSDDEKKRAKAFGTQRQVAREAKERADKAEQRANELAERLARLEGAASVTAPKAEAQPSQDAEPDRLMYPDDWQEWNTRKLEKRLEKAEQLAQQAQQFTTYQSELRGVEALDKQYKSANPKDDLDGAKAFLMKQERENMKLLRPDLKDSQIESQLESDKMVLYRALHQQGRNPAEVLMALAKKAGYKSGAEPAPKRDLTKLAENQRKATNLIGGSPASKPAGSRLNSDDLFNMSMDKLVKASRKDKNLFAVDE